MHYATQHSSNRLVSDFMNLSSNPEWHEQVPVQRLNGPTSFHPRAISLFPLNVSVRSLSLSSSRPSDIPHTLLYLETCIVFL